MSLSLTRTETFFMRLLRATIVSTAAIALLVVALALCYAAFAYFSPAPTMRMTNQVVRLRNAVDPRILILEVFPVDSSVHKEAATANDVSSYEFRQPTDEQLFDSFNRFLDFAIHARFSNKDQFSEWVSQSGATISWPETIDNGTSNGENNTIKFLRSLLIDYSERLSAKAPFLQNANKKKLYSEAFDRLTSPTGNANAPYFVAWYFIKLQNELNLISEEFSEKKNEYEALRSQIPVALEVATGAFGYFILIMFLFLVVSIELSLRRMAEK